MLAIFEGGNPYNASGYENADYDAVYRAQAILMNDLPFISIYH